MKISTFFVLFGLILCFNLQSFGQKVYPLRICSQSSGVSTYARIESTITGDINLIPCTGRNVFKNGVAFGDSSGNLTFATSAITSGVFAPARLATGTADNTKFLRGDGTWSIVPSGATTFATSAITSGVFAPARLATGTADDTKFLRGDGTWSTLPSGGNGSSPTVLDLSNLTPSNVSVIPLLAIGESYLIFSYGNDNGGKFKINHVGQSLLGQSGNYYGVITANNLVTCNGIAKLYRTSFGYWLDAPFANCTVTV